MGNRSYYRPDEIAEALPEYASVHLRPALSGDVHAAGRLVTAAPNDMRGHVVRCLFEANAPREVFRAALSDAWEHDHAHVCNAFRTVRRFREAFTRASFHIPEELSGTMSAWRGTAGIEFHDSAMGFSWTLDRDVACFFAMRHASAHGNPLVLKRTIYTQDILYFSDQRREREIVTVKVRPVAIDGDVEDWSEGMSRFLCRGSDI